jgi:hypothetical protein
VQEGDVMPGFVRRLIARVRYRHFEEELRRELDVYRAMVEDAHRVSLES